MKVETLGELLALTRDSHRQLSERLADSARGQPESTTRWLMEYAAEREAEMAQRVDGLMCRTDSNVLQTWVYEWLQHPHADPQRIEHTAFGEMDFAEISEALFSVHNELMDLYRQLFTRADIDEARAVVDEVLQLEEGRSRQMAQQVNRIRDM